MSDRDFIIQEIRKLFNEKIDKQDIDQEEQRAREVYKIIAKKNPPPMIKLSGAGDNMTISGVKVPKEFVPYILGQDASLPTKNKTNTSTTEKPTPAKYKVASAKDARSTEDLSFAEIIVPAEYEKRYKQIKAGMDMGETGDCSSINAAAVSILGSDPKVIYTALINSGVLPANYVPPPKPCDGLSKLIRDFQYLATQGKLRYQKKIDPSGDLAKGLAYKPSIDTQDLSQQAADAFEKPKNSKIAGGRTSINEQMISVDGKIGSRTAKLLKVYASKESFEKLKTKAGVKPKPAPKSTNTGKSTSPKNPESGCNIVLESKDHIRVATVLTIMGTRFCNLGKESKGSQARTLVPYFSELLQIFQTARGVTRQDFGNNAKKKKDRISRLASSQGQIDSFKSFIKDKKNVNTAFKSVYPQMRKFYNQSVSSQIFDFYAGQMGGPRNISNVFSFAHINIGGDKVVPLIYRAADSEYGELEGFLRAINYYDFLAETTPQGRLASLKKNSLKGDGLFSNLAKHQASVDMFQAAISEHVNMPRFNDKESQRVLQYANNIIKKYNLSLKLFIKYYRQFSGPNATQEIFSQIIRYGGPVTTAQRLVNDR